MSDDSKKTKIALKEGIVLFDLIRNRKILLFDGLVIGRTEGNERFPEDTQMSRSHVKITLKGMNIFVEDLGSTNKTRVNRQVIAPNKPFMLSVSSIIEFGSQKLELRIGVPATGQNRPTPLTPSTTRPTISMHSKTPNKPISFSDQFRTFFNPKNWGFSTAFVFLFFTIIALIIFKENSGALPTCSSSYFPDFLRYLPFQMFLSFFSTGLVATLIQIASNHVLKKKLWKGILALALVLSGTLVCLHVFFKHPTDKYKEVNSGIFSRRTLQYMAVATCACPRDHLNTRIFIACEQWVKNDTFEPSLLKGSEIKFSKIPREAQEVIAAYVAQHPLSLLSQEDRRQLSEAYESSKKFREAKDYEQVLKFLKVVHQFYPSGYLESKQMEIEANREKKEPPLVVSPIVPSKPVPTAASGPQK